MKNKRNLAIILGLFAFLVIFVVIFLNNQEKPAEQVSNQEIKPDTYSSAGVIKKIEPGKLQIEMKLTKAVEGQTAPSIVTQTKTVLVDDSTQVLRWITTGSKKTLNKLRISDLRVNMEIAVISTSDPNTSDNVTATKIEVIGLK